ncbi:MAG: sigma-70 family RNA polymerase sigma factor [Crocinitomicaceae bacterium]|nr:sigma-70 family RNA polymerase sigma factor [Crocinitomicaceae bacterium]
MRNVVNIHRDLIERSKNGDRIAQKSLFDLYSKAIYNIGVRLLGNTEDAADITQDTFIDAFTKLDQFSYKATFGAWLKKIMVNKSLNFLNRRKIHFDLEEDLEEVLEEQNNVEELMIQLNSSLKDLPEGCRVIFTLFYFEGLDHQEISSELSVSVSTSKSQLSRARQLLRELIEQKIEA